MGRIGLVLLGILAGQLILYGASFTGDKILLPLDALALPMTYIPMKPGQFAQLTPSQLTVLSDPVLEDEPARIFRCAELRARRLPIWNPYQYAGVPSISFLSPFAIFGALVRSPLILPWLSLALALVGGFGAYIFSRRVLQVGVWPATIAAWCYPITGFFVFWQSYSLPHPIVWLPWLLYGVHAVLSGSGRWALPGLALTTFLTVISGHLDMAGLVLIMGGLFAAWKFLNAYRDPENRRIAIQRLIAVAAGWMLGFMLASPELLPALEYAKTGSRLNRRGAGLEERPPIGLASLPQLVLPDLYGATNNETVPFVPNGESNVAESPAAGFSGLIASLVIAPLAWGSRRHRSLVVFFGAAAILGTAWCLNLPGIVQLMRMPPLNNLSYNRFVFASSFAILALAAIGLEESAKGTFRWNNWYYIPMAILGGASAWCLFRSCVLPEAIGVTLAKAIASGYARQWVHDMEGVGRVQRWFSHMYLSSGLLCLLALGLWVYLRLRKKLPNSTSIVLGLLAFAELIFFAYGRAAQSDPKLYYPPILPADKIARSTPGRTVAYKCLPANLLQTMGLFDVRGYDGVDPARLVDLVDLAGAPDTGKFDYAALQFFVPQISSGRTPAFVHLSPVLDLLGVRYVIAPNEDYTRYFVLVNESALPRAFVPRSVEVEPDRARRLAALANVNFDPRQVAYVEDPAMSVSAAEGEAVILEDTPQQIVVSTKLAQSGLVVLADQWNSGWRAYIGNKSLPILRVDHALRGIIVPAGESTIVFRYQPLSLRLGVGAALLAMLVLIAWVLATGPMSRSGMSTALSAS